MADQKVKYDCGKCPAYCCSYNFIEVTEKDLKRLAKHFDLDVETARRKFTKKGQKEGEMALRHTHDYWYGTACRFLDRETRNCSIYHARPSICRKFPGMKRCGYYDFLTFERHVLEDPEYVSITNNT
jgi:uncharacterized protein